MSKISATVIFSLVLLLTRGVQAQENGAAAHQHMASGGCAPVPAGE